VSLKIVHVAAEVAPYSKVGGLADVAGSLPLALAAQGVECRLVTPRYRGTDIRGVRDGVTGRVGKHQLHVHRGQVGAVEVDLIECPELFDRPQIYGEADDGDRFALLARAGLAIAADWGADIVHAHDWHGALAPMLATGQTTVLTIHNLAYQGHQPPAFAVRHGLPAPPVEGDYGPEAVNLLGRGIASASAVTTVSPTYAREISSGPELGYGLEGLLAARDVRGIVNGIDVERFDPANDPALTEPFDASDPSSRAATRQTLRALMGLAPGDGPVIGVVARLFHQKGLDLLLAAAPAVLADGARLVVLGTGDADLEDGFRRLAAAHPRRVAVRIDFDAGLAQQIYGGCDIFCMPSRFEPCGLGQLIAMRYGAVPVARRTGGLADTVPAGAGFLFDDASPEALTGALHEAFEAFADPPRWDAIVRRAMAVDHSWARSARAYVELYEELVAGGSPSA
jgi:starch synthase